MDICGYIGIYTDKYGYIGRYADICGYIDIYEHFKPESESGRSRRGFGGLNKNMCSYK